MIKGSRLEQEIRNQRTSGEEKEQINQIEKLEESQSDFHGDGNDDYDGIVILLGIIAFVIITACGFS